jgi:hypothetical protein
MAIGEPVNDQGVPIDPVTISSVANLTIPVIMISATAVASWDQIKEAVTREPAGTIREEIILLKPASLLMPLIRQLPYCIQSR